MVSILRMSVTDWCLTIEIRINRASKSSNFSQIQLWILFLAKPIQILPYWRSWWRVCYFFHIIDYYYPTFIRLIKKFNFRIMIFCAFFNINFAMFNIKSLFNDYKWTSDHSEYYLNNHNELENKTYWNLNLRWMTKSY